MQDFTLYAICLIVAYILLAFFTFPPSIGMAVLLSIPLYIAGVVIRSYWGKAE